MDNNQKVNSIFSGKNGKNSQASKADLNEQNNWVEEIMAVMEMEVELPDGIVEKVMQKKERVKIDKTSGFDFFKYLQIAAVLAAGMFLGVLLGSNADINSFNKEKSDKDRAVMELCEKYHITDDYSFGRL